MKMKINNYELEHKRKDLSFQLSDQSENGRYNLKAFALV